MATDFGKGNRAIAFNPTSAFPLDARTYFESYSEALAKAQTAEEVGSTNTQYHYGMKILVKDGNTFTWYKIVKGEPYLEAEGTGGSSGGNGEGEYDGDTGTIDYTSEWFWPDSLPISKVPTVANGGITISFTSNGTRFVGMARSGSQFAGKLVYVKEDGTSVTVYTFGLPGTWENYYYKYITFHEQVTDETILGMLSSATLVSGSLEGVVIRDPDRTANLPTIRFVGFSTDTGSFYAPNEWHFTIEVLGGGRLRLGDYFELCAMRTCKRPQSDISAGVKRQRLRRIARKVITDTQFKYLTLVVTSAEDAQLFKNDRNAVSTGNCRSNIYLRLKRPFLDENGYENFAKFSNVIALQKSYDFESRHLSIK